MAQKYPTYLQFDICQNFRSFFFWDPSLNKFLDPSTPSMRKVDDGEKRKEKKKEKKERK